MPAWLRRYRDGWVGGFSMSRYRAARSLPKYGLPACRSGLCRLAGSGRVVLRVEPEWRGGRCVSRPLAQPEGSVQPNISTDVSDYSSIRRPHRIGSRSTDQLNRNSAGHGNLEQSWSLRVSAAADDPGAI